ncbi:TolC family protein [Lentibacter algarum]|uniref:TolC family protein n=1 Tax=Lentibacter algarum TaxID=576131 RepID=UPI00248F6B3A|nr:TolC family protein [Lentibacter algarum]
MDSKPFTIAAGLVLLASCDAPTEMSEMRMTVEQRLTTFVSEATISEASPIALTQGLAPALRAAVSTNEGYLGALALEAEAMGQVGVAASARRLQLTGNANIGGNRETGTNADTTTGVAGGMNLSQLVYDGGASASVINRSNALALSAQAERVVQSNEIALSAARAWIDLWQYSERLRLMQARTAEMDALIDQIERMASNGMLDKASLENAQRQIVDIKLEESRLAAGKAEAHVLFHRFFHVKPEWVAQPSELIGAGQVRSLAQDWQTAPGLQRQAAELLAAQAAVGEAQSAFKPSVRLQAGAGSPLDSADPTSLTVGLSLQYSFSDGGRRKKQLEASEARVVAMDAQLRDAQRRLEAELKVSLNRLASIESEMPLLADKLRLSRSEAATSRSQILTGQSSLRQLIEAEIEIYRAQNQHIELQAERQTLLLTIAARTGALSGIVGLQD